MLHGVVVYPVILALIALSHYLSSFAGLPFTSLFVAASLYALQLHATLIAVGRSLVLPEYTVQIALVLLTLLVAYESFVASRLSKRTTTATTTKSTKAPENDDSDYEDVTFQIKVPKLKPALALTPRSPASSKKVASPRGSSANPRGRSKSPRRRVAK